MRTVHQRAAVQNEGTTLSRRLRVTSINSKSDVQLNDFPQSIMIVLQQSAHILEIRVPRLPRRNLHNHRRTRIPSTINSTLLHETHRKFFSPSLVIAEGQTLHSWLGFVRHATEGTPPTHQLGTPGGGGDGGAPEVPVPSMMREVARG